MTQTLHRTRRRRRQDGARIGFRQEIDAVSDGARAFAAPAPMPLESRQPRLPASDNDHQKRAPRNNRRGQAASPPTPAHDLDVRRQNRNKRAAVPEPDFRLTYSTMFDPPAEVHLRFDAALTDVRANLGAEHAMLIGGEDVRADGQFASVSPIDTELVLGRFQEGTSADVDLAVEKARAAWPAWARTPWPRRVDILLHAAQLIEASAFHLAAAVSLEVGKNRMEALADVQETVDLIRWYCREMQDNRGFVREMPKDPLPGDVSRNRSVLKSYGVWAVIAPFNFPFALAGGPASAALIAGNCVVFKAASATPWSGWLLSQCLRESGVPPGVFNYLTGAGERVGDPLVRHPHVAGVTFTGSYDVGMSIVRMFAQGRYPRPCIAEMGGKNAVIVSRHADLERAALGIVRSAFGLQGQKCSACSRILVERVVADQLVDRIVGLVRKIRVGDPTLQDNWMGPVINRAAHERFGRIAGELHSDGQILCGGHSIDEGDLVRGYYCAPTLAQLPLGHRLWREEVFLPLTLLSPVASLDEAMEVANGIDFGLTAGFYGAREELDWFLEHIEAGVTYCNRPQGATTGAWPGYQPFGGWKGSGSTGRACGSFYYLQQYMREQSQTIVD
jgi:1-pyrroline-5-carboxylate dehydrogenase